MPALPTIDHKESAIAYRQEHFDRGELTIRGDGGLDEAVNYEQWIKKINADLEKDSGGFVPATTYFAFAGDKLVGTIQIRYRMNDYLLKYGGHIGYGVVPSERRKGYIEFFTWKYAHTFYICLRILFKVSTQSKSTLE